VLEEEAVSWQLGGVGGQGGHATDGCGTCLFWPKEEEDGMGWLGHLGHEADGPSGLHRERMGKKVKRAAGCFGPRKKNGTKVFGCKFEFESMEFSNSNKSLNLLQK
jgi:hypothetical protein